MWPRDAFFFVDIKLRSYGKSLISKFQNTKNNQYYESVNKTTV